ncbi:phosphoglycolate phosphatase [Andreprevotia lacus DSM 23236]|jgi:phosphoglycolate phosphatase|uniref:Phosphoglycolate phosphatase n=1 Tax=Andreprevotia lacus DSM 23236 TaxID=1121001 RepID=A0A1W1X6L8_9NEIS|nr:HAD-IA family hydrolase [Andreprevotia lacus]SMC19494.1 phosphoglycolate phosphatase [Andreprevotia lacus DSM 23236]
MPAADFANPARRFDLLVFDWDGTLMDSTGTIAHAIQLAFGELGLPVPTDSDARFVIGYGLREAMQHLAPAADAATITAIVDAYRHHYLARDEALVLFDGVREGLQALGEAGFQLAVATGKSRVGLDRALASTGLGYHFVATRTADESFSKPHPAMLEYLFDETMVPAQRAVMIGDTTHDLQLAINAGCASLAMSYGAHPLDELLALSPLAHFDDFKQLSAWILQHG